MKSKGYTLLGWVVWRLGTRVAKRKLASHRPKLIAAMAIAAVAAIGIALASFGRDDGE